MAVYEVAVDVKKQIDKTACWASLALAVATAKGYKTPTQAGLLQQFAAKVNQADGPTKGQYHPDLALWERFAIGSDTTALARSPDAAAVLANKTKLAAVIKASLEGGWPLILGLTTANDAALPRRDGAAGVRWGHAVLLFKYDDANGNVWLKDPARGDNVEVQTTVGGLVSGFAYMSAAQMGPQAQALLDIPDGIIARVFKVIAPFESLRSLFDD